RLLRPTATRTGQCTHQTVPGDPGPAEHSRRTGRLIGGGCRTGRNPPDPAAYSAAQRCPPAVHQSQGERTGVRLQRRPDAPYAGALLPHLSAHRTRRGQGDPRLRLRPVARAAVRPPLPCLPARPLPVVAQTQRTEPAGQPRLSLVPGPGPPDDGV